MTKVTLNKVNSADRYAPADFIVNSTGLTNMPSNQEIERCYFEMFRNHYTLPPGTIVFGDRPDVMIEGQRRIGIEVTNFFREKGSLTESEQIQNKLRSKVVSDAQSLFVARNPKGIQITFGFDKDNPIRDKKVVSTAIAELAEAIQGRQSGVIERDTYRTILELSYVYLNAEPIGDPKWMISQFSRGQLMSRDRLLDIVRAKEAHAANYRPCDAYWLLVVVDHINAAQDQEIRVDDFERITSDVFEKVIVYRTLVGHVFEVK
jgi:hypothetical protein